MHSRAKAILIVLTGALSCVSAAGFAQTNDDVLIFDNQTNDFLLPSFFDTPAPKTPQPAVPAKQATPQNVPADIDILNEIFGDQAVATHPLQTTPQAPQTASQTFYPTPKTVKQSTAQPLLTPLAPLPQVPEATIPPPKRIQHSSPYVSRLLAKESGKSKANIQLPRDIRLQFNPQAIQLTDPAVKWISAYALHVQKNPTLVVNLRVSAQNWPIQQARLGLIMQIMMEKGLPARQIQIYQSDRDPDSVIIGADVHPDQTKAITPEDTKQIIKEQKTLIW